MIKTIRRAFYVPLFFSLLLGGCTNEIKKDFQPIARGEADEIIIVIDSLQWNDSALGEILKNTFSAPKEGLPQREPLFNLKKVNPIKLNSVLKSAINMIFLMTLDSHTAEMQSIRKLFPTSSLTKIKEDSSLYVKVLKDVFAKGQTVMFLFSQSEEELVEKIRQNQNYLQRVFEKNSAKVIHSKLYRQHEKQLEKVIKEEYGITLSVPYGWQLAKNEKQFLWLRKMDARTEQSLFIYHEPYKDASSFDNIATFRDEITHQNLRDSENQSVYITRQDILDLETKKITFDGKYAVETRGLWKISDGSRGGPFVSYTILNEKTGIIYYIEGYVDSPGTKKKMLINELEVILSTFKAESI